MSVSSDKDVLTAILTSSNILWRYGRRGDLSLDIDDEEEPHDNDENYITIQSEDGDSRIGVLFDDDGKIVSLTTYS